MFNHDGSKLSGRRVISDLNLIASTLSGPKFKLGKKTREIHLAQYEQQMHYIKDDFNTAYSIEEMASNIHNDSEPCHIPSLKNLDEIGQIFDKIDNIIQHCV